MNYVEILEAKWGTFEKVGHSLVNGSMPFISDLARLNMLFPAQNTDFIASFVHDKFNCDLPAQLLEFYRKYNGCRLFFGSLNIFGIQQYPGEMYQPYDLYVENNHILGNMKKQSKDACNMLFVASIGGDYAFGIDKTNPGKVTGIKKGSSMVPVQTFPDFMSFFDSYFNKLLNEYDTSCRKIHPSMRFSGIPALEHVTSEIL